MKHAFFCGMHCFGIGAKTLFAQSVAVQAFPAVAVLLWVAAAVSVVYVFVHAISIFEDCLSVPVSPADYAQQMIDEAAQQRKEEEEQALSGSRWSAAAV